MSSISAIIIAKNAEEIIEDCLVSVSFCDEIIVVDSDSTDNTISISEKIGAKVYKQEFRDFSKARNFGLEKARGDWILYIDADERIDDRLKTSIIRLTTNSDRTQQLNVYFLKRKNYYLGNHEWPYIEKLERLFRKSSLRGWQGELHESPIYEGSLGELNGFLIHYTHRNLSSMFAKTIEWSKIEAELRFKTGHPKMTWWRFPRVMISAFLNSYIKQGGWKVGAVGLIESIYQGFSMFITYARLWEMQEKK